MGLFAFLRRLFDRRREPAPSAWGAPGPPEQRPSLEPSELAADKKSGWDGPPLARRLPPLSYETSLVRTDPRDEIVAREPYAFARFGPGDGTFLDLSRDGDDGWLDEFGLPRLHTPAQLADWLGVPLGRLFWLTGRTQPSTIAKSHYVASWIGKQSGGQRLIESPKPSLRAVQARILDGILNKVPPHAAAHGFRRGRSVVTNARPHTGSAVLLKHDLEDFYGSVRRSRVAAVFRTLGFNREVALWLTDLTTCRSPVDLAVPGLAVNLGLGCMFGHLLRSHLPQGAPTSPALANLSAFGLDVRLSGLARIFDATYTRYADDLTFSGGPDFLTSLRQFIPLSEQIIRDERLTPNRAKRKVIRKHQRMRVTGVVVNERPNVARDEFDRLKATLHNCLKTGPAAQNREGLADFRAHLRGRIAFVQQCNARRGAKLLAMFEQIKW